MSDKFYTREDIKSGISDWLKENPYAPDIVRLALTGYIDLIDRLDVKSAKLQRLLRELRKAFGIEPKSERRRSGKNSRRKKSKRKRFEEELEAALSRAQKYAKYAKRHQRKVKVLEDKLKKLDDIELTKKEETEARQESEQFAAEVSLGHRTDLCCAQPTEILMHGAGVTVEEDEVVCEIPDEQKSKAKKIFTEDRQRIDFNFTVTIQHIEVEKAEVEGPMGPTIISGSTQDLGPPKMNITWNFLANMTILASQYAMPLNRFAGLVSSDEKQFSSAEMTRYFHHVAVRGLPVYLNLGTDLSNTEVLSGDDTSTLVVEFQKAMAAEGKVPWSPYATTEAALKTLKDANTDPNMLAAQLASVLGFESERKDQKGPKRALNVSVLTGRTDIHDPKSTIVFYRSHIGGLGNLISNILKYRDPSKRKLVIQSDLSTVNLTDKDLPWDVKHAGCVSHARRRFVKNESDDDFGASMVHLFKVLYFHEETLDDLGRNTDNTQAVRKGSSRAYWDLILEDCEIIKQKWSKDTGLGDAARYVLRNVDALTCYLNDHRLSLSNDFCERMLRMEKLILANSYFRQTLEGRFALDITRTLLQTAIAAKVNIQSYLIWLLKSDPEKIEAQPQKFTPYAYSKIVG